MKENGLKLILFAGYVYDIKRRVRKNIRKLRHRDSGLVKAD
jgi:hypothetical protein